MRLSPLILLPLLSQVLAQQKEGKAEKFDYQSDVARLRKIVVESLYSVRGRPNYYMMLVLIRYSLTAS